MRVLLQTLHHLARQVKAEVVGEALQDGLHHQPFGALVDMLGCIFNADATLLPQLPLVDRAVVLVPGEAVDLVHHKDVKETGPGVLDHLQELGAVVGMTCNGLVGVGLD
ncbi:MAG: hypothetical protein QME76_07000 [Bacillota bacterium]|nr:hypothetical protein [Bacillota bacterium]